MRHWNALFGIVFIAGGLLAPGGCTSGEGHRQESLSGRRIRIVATTGMIADLARAVGGDRCEVEALMGPGVDPHLYKASEGDVRRMGSADLILYNGLHLEGAMAEVLGRMAMNRRTVAVSDGVSRHLLLDSPNYPGQHDPHIWFDVSLWIQAAQRVRDALIAMDTTHTDVYRVNAGRYLDSLQALDSYVRAQSETVPAEGRVLITAHDAFNYFGRAYGFEVRGLQGISTVTEAGTADVQSLAAFIAQRRIPAIFVESSVPPRSIEAVRQAVRARGFEVQIGGELFSDAMGTPGTPEGTYLGMVRHNIQTIVSALLMESEHHGRTGAPPRVIP